MQRKLLVWLCLIPPLSLLFGCGGAGSNLQPPPPPPPPGFQVNNVFVVVLENHGYNSVIGNAVMPYLNSLASRYALATNYFADAHPSIGNYFMLTTGQTITNDDNFAGVVSDDNIVRQLVAAGRTWKGYFSALPSIGYLGGDKFPYVKHHNPFAYLRDVIDNPALQANLVPMSQLGQDTAVGELPQFGFIVPDDLEDGHGCLPGVTCSDAVLLAAADTWLQNNIDPLIKSAAFQRGGVLFITWDESETSDNSHGGGQVATVVVSPGARTGFRSTVFYQHENLLRTVLQELRVQSFPGASANAQAMVDFLPSN